MEQVTIENPALIALQLREETACAGYLTARKTMVRWAGRVASLARLVAEQPRADYRNALAHAVDSYHAARQRTRIAFTGWQRARDRYDVEWTRTEGRHPRRLAELTGTAA